MSAALASLALVIFVSALLAGCQSPPRSQVVRGVIPDLQARNPARADWIRLRTESGAELQIAVADSVLFSAGHLREHMIFGEPVTVTYEQRPEGPVATAIGD